MEAAPVAVATVRTARTSVQEVRFVLFDEATLDVFRRALDG
jgi:O-acetyl-ADP-ribose deacetylase (regulator of RNase III)